MALKSNVMRNAVKAAWSISKITGLAFTTIAKITMFIAHKVSK